ncbi:MAG: flippase [Anaerolineales bacterium]|nr:flippase [Anaerolineales bacterium]
MSLNQHLPRLLRSATMRRVSLNTVWLLVGRLSSQGLLFLFSILVARALGEVGLGQYAFITSVVFVGNMLTTFGMDTLLIRDIARQEQSAPLAGALVIQLALSLLFIFVVYLSANFLPNQNVATATALRIYSLALLPMAFFTVFTAALRAHERMDLFLIVGLVTAVTQTGGAFFLLQQQSNLYHLAWLLVIVQILGAAVGGWLCYQHLLGFTFNWPRLTTNQLQQSLRLGLPLALLTACTVFYRRMGIFALSTLADDATTGWFSAAMRLVEIGRMVPYALFGALFPVLARRETAVSSPPQHRHTLTLLGLLAEMAAIAALLWLFAAPLITWLYGSSYAPSISALRILAWSLPPFAAAMALSVQLIAQQRERFVLAVTGVTLLGTAVALYLVIPHWGLSGAAWTLIGSETLQTLLLLAAPQLRNRLA